MLRPALGRMEVADEEHQRDHPEREVDGEHEPPRQVLGEDPTEDRSADARHQEDDARVADELREVAGGHEVAQDRERQRHEPTGSHSLDRTEHHELGHGLRGAAEDRAEEERHQRHDEDPLAPVEVAQLPVERGRDHGHQQVRGREPGQIGQPVQVTDDRGQRGRHDRRVERGEGVADHEPDEHDPDAARGLRSALARRRELHPIPLRGEGS